MIFITYSVVFSFCFLGISSQDYDPIQYPRSSGFNQEYGSRLVNQQLALSKTQQAIATPEPTAVKHPAHQIVKPTSHRSPKVFYSPTEVLRSKTNHHHETQTAIKDEITKNFGRGNRAFTPNYNPSNKYAKCYCIEDKSSHSIIFPAKHLRP